MRGSPLDAQFVETAKARCTRSSCDPLPLVAQNLSPTAHNVRTELGEWGSDTASVPVSRSGRRHRVASGRVLVPCTQKTVSTVAQERSPVYRRISVDLPGAVRRCLGLDRPSRLHFCSRSARSRTAPDIDKNFGSTIRQLNRSVEGWPIRRVW
jgi:hypothetical protein